MLNEWLFNNIHVIWLVLVLIKEKFHTSLHHNLYRMKKASCVMLFVMSFLVCSTRSAASTGIQEVNRFCSEKNHTFRGVFTPQNNRALYTESGLRFIVPL